MSNELLVDAALDYEANPTLLPTIRASKDGQTDIVQVVPVYVLAVDGGDPLTASTLSRVGGPTDYPPELDFTRPIDWYDGIYAVVQRSTDPSFATGVSEAVNQIYAATTSYDFGLSAVVSGEWFFRMGAWETTRPSNGSMEWSNVVNVGDVVAPTLSGGGATSSDENEPMAVTVTSDELAYFSLTGADASLLELSTSGGATSVTVRLVGDADLNYEAKASYSFNVVATDYAGNVSTPLACTHTVDDVSENPTGLVDFTTHTGATVSTAYTSNTQVISLPVGYPAPFAVTGGTLVKNSVDVGATGTVVNGDVVALAGSSPASANSTSTVSVDIGGDATPVTVTFDIQTATTIPQFASLGFRFENAIGNFAQNAAGTTPVTTAGQAVACWADTSGNGRNLVNVGGSGSFNPTFRVTSGINELEFDGTNDILGWNGGDPGLYTASGYTAMFVGRFPTPAANKLMLGASNESVAQQYVSIVASDSATASMGNSSMRSNAGSTFVAATVDHFASAWDGSNHVYIVVDDGSGITWYVDGVAGTRQAYTRSGNSITLTNLSVGALWRNTVLSYSASRAQGVLIWPGVVLDAGEIAQATTYGGTLQGRTL